MGIVALSGATENCGILAYNMWIGGEATVLTLAASPQADLLYRDLEIPPGIAIPLKFIATRRSLRWRQPLGQHS